MEIRVTDLPVFGLELKNEKLSLEGLRQRYGDNSKDGVEFREAPCFSGKAVPCHGGAILTGDLSFSFKQPCSLCTDLLDEIHSISINIMFRERPAGSDPSSEEFEDDVGLVYFEGDKISLDEPLFTEIIINVPSANRPKESDCGDCRVCGKNISRSISDAKPANTMKGLLEAAMKKTQAGG